MCGGRGGRRCGALRGPTPLTQRSRGCFSDQALKGLCSKVPSRTNGSRCSSRALRCSYFLLISEFVERCLVDSLRESGGFKGKKDISYLLREFRREKIFKIKKSKTVRRSEAYEREIESERRLKKKARRERERPTVYGRSYCRVERHLATRTLSASALIHRKTCCPRSLVVSRPCHTRSGSSSAAERPPLLLPSSLSSSLLLLSSVQKNLSRSAPL